MIWGFANGVDLSPVLDTLAPNKGYGNSTTMARDVTDREEADKVLLALSETVAARLRADHVRAEVVSVGIKYNDLSYVSHQKVLGASTDLTVDAIRERFGMDAVMRAVFLNQPIDHMSGGINAAKLR